MDRRERMKELYEKVDNVKPLAEKDGEVWVSFEDAAILNSYNADEPKTGMQTRNPDGSLASTGKRVHAVNPDYFFANRYKVKGKKMYIVSGHTSEGYRCIKEQETGRVFLKTIPAYVVARDPDGNLFVEKMVVISDSEFVGDFTDKLPNHLFAEILPLITSYGKVGATATEMPI